MKKKYLVNPKVIHNVGNNYYLLLKNISREHKYVIVLIPNMNGRREGPACIQLRNKQQTKR